MHEVNPLFVNMACSLSFLLSYHSSREIRRPSGGRAGGVRPMSERQKARPGVSINLRTGRDWRLPAEIQSFPRLDIGFDARWPNRFCGNAFPSGTGRRSWPRGLRRPPPGIGEELAARFDIGVRNLQRLFGRYVGVSPKWVIRRFRLQEAAEQMEEGEIPIGRGCPQSLEITTRRISSKISNP